jgi:hypothetical protein
VSAQPGPEPLEAGAAVVAEDDELAVENDLVPGQRASDRHDPGSAACGRVGAVTRA